jgi:hypothetical protein
VRWPDMGVKCAVPGEYRVCGAHDISTEVFGRAYLEVRAGYFTH